MSDRSAIEWTDATWNPVTGCSKVSQGCKHCYALREWPRLSAPRPTPNAYTGRAFTDVREHLDRLEQPLSWRRPRRINASDVPMRVGKKAAGRQLDGRTHDALPTP